MLFFLKKKNMNEYIRLFLFASTWSLSKLPRGHTIPHNLHMLSTHTPFQLSHWPPVNPTFFFLHVCVCKRPLCCVWAAKHRSEEWLPVKKWLLFQLENWSVCGLSVCQSVCLPSSFPSALRGRRHFRRDRRVTGSIAKAIAPCQHSHLHWNWKQRGSWAAWQHCGGGGRHFTAPSDWVCGCSEKFHLSSNLVQVLLSSGVRLFGWRLQELEKRNHTPHWG